MISVPPGVRVLLAARPVDFRTTLQASAAIVQARRRRHCAAADRSPPRRGRHSLDLRRNPYAQQKNPNATPIGRIIPAID